MKTKLQYLLLVAAAVLLASCGSRKKALEATAGTSPDAVDHSAAALNRLVDNVNENRLTAEAVTARLSLSLAAGEKSVSVGGNLRMKRNDVIQMTLVMLGLMEVGRMELTPDYFMVVNRMEHQYVKASYDDVSFFSKNGIDFYTFQSLFWDELFVAGNHGKAPDGKHFQKTVEGGDLRLINDDARQMVLTFMADMASSMVRSTSFTSKNASDPAALEWHYLDYTKLNRQNFPSRMQVKVNASSRPLSATISLSNVKASSDWETRTQLGKKYSPISFESAFNSILRMAK